MMELITITEKQLAEEIKRYRDRCEFDDIAIAASLEYNFDLEIAKIYAESMGYEIKESEITIPLRNIELALKGYIMDECGEHKIKAIVDFLWVCGIDIDMEKLNKEVAAFLEGIK